MNKVLIVDDEVFVRIGLSSMLDWEAIGYEVCGEANNGQEALELMKALKPDVVITDIRMPVMDGLELIRIVTSEWKRSPVFIIISGYHDFQYAQNALRYGVHDYILKPIDEIELETTLKKLSVTLQAHELTQHSSLNNSDLTIVETLIKGEYYGDEVNKLTAALQMEIDAAFVYLLAELHPPQEEDQGESRYAVKDIVSCLEGLMDDADDRLLVYEHQQGLFGMVLNLSHYRNSIGSLDYLTYAIHSSLTKMSCTSVTLYLGKQVEHIKNIQQSYNAAKEAMSYKYAEDGAKIIDISDVHGTPLYYFDIDRELYEKLLEQLEEKETSSCIQTIELIFEQFQKKRFAPNAVSNCISRCVISVINVIREMGGSEKNLSTFHRMNEWQLRQVNLTSLKKAFLAFIQEAAVEIHRLRQEQAKGGIERIRKYIETHYTENINLKSISAQFYMNSVYLGQLFRKTYGVYFNDYLLRIRIQEAKRLLRQTDLRMYEIAEKIGFQNADYFVTQFEKLENMTPKDYRNKLLGKPRNGGVPNEEVSS